MDQKSELSWPLHPFGLRPELQKPPVNMRCFYCLGCGCFVNNALRSGVVSENYWMACHPTQWRAKPKSIVTLRFFFPCRESEESLRPRCSAKLRKPSQIETTMGCVVTQVRLPLHGRAERKQSSSCA